MERDDRAFPPPPRMRFGRYGLSRIGPQNLVKYLGLSAECLHGTARHHENLVEIGKRGWAMCDHDDDAVTATNRVDRLCQRVVAALALRTHTARRTRGRARPEGAARPC